MIYEPQDTVYLKILFIEYSVKKVKLSFLFLMENDAYYRMKFSKAYGCKSWCL